jgi:hypothetical protein
MGDQNRATADYSAALRLDPNIANTSNLRQVIQENNNTVRITISGIDGFSGWYGTLILSTRRDLDDRFFVAIGEVWITAGAATFVLMGEDSRRFVRTGQYYVLLGFSNSRSDRYFVSYNLQNIISGTQHIAFNYDAFYETNFEF